MTIRKPARIAILAAALAGCAQIIGFPDYGTGGTGGTAGAASATTTSTSTTTATTSSSSSGAGGGDAGCDNGAPCYAGPPGTEGIGACHGGTLTCDADGGSCASQGLPSVERCTTPDVDENCDGIAACTGQFRWAATLAGAATADLVAAGSDGTVAVAGTSSAGPLIGTFDASGRPCWSPPSPLGTGTITANAMTLAGAGPAYATVSCPAGGLVASTVVVGQVSGQVTFGQRPAQTSAGGLDAFVALLDPTGKVAWSDVFGSAGDDEALGVTTTPDGYVYVTGVTAGALGLSCAGALDGGTETGPGAFVAKLRVADGSCVWAQVWPGATAQATGVAVEAATYVDVVGTFVGTLTVGGQPITQPGANNTFFVQLHEDGTYSNATSYTVDNTGPVRIAAGPASSRVYVSGTAAHGLSNTAQGELCPAVQGQQAYFIAIGQTLLTAAYVCYGTGYTDAGGDTVALGVAVDTAGNAVLALAGSGTIQNPQVPFPAPLVAPGFVAFKFPPPPPYGDYLWQYPIAMAPPSSAGVAVDGLGNVVIAATGSGSVDLGGTTLDAGASAAFVVELAP
jgi:hypothetical protein